MKKLVSLLLVLVMLFSLCSVAMADDDLVTIKILCKNDFNSTTKTADWEKYTSSQILIADLAELGIRLELECIDNANFANVVTTRMAAGVDLPDMIAVAFEGGVGPEQIIQWGKDGLIISADEIIEKYDDDNSILTYWESKAPGTVTSNRADDGVLYWFAYVAGNTTYCLDTQRYSTGLNYRTPSIRADWLAKIGEEPKLSYTPDELIDILLRFQENDVNGNGLKDEVVCCKISNNWDNFSANFGLSTSRLVYIDKNGVATSNFYNENLVPYLEFMKKLYDLGLYDTSAMVTTDMTHELITSNRAAITFDYAVWTDYEKQIIQEEALYVPFILDMDGDLNNGFTAYCDVSTTTYNQYFVTSACKHPEAVGKLMDYIFTDHYALLDMRGTPETYTLDEQGNVIANDMTDIYNSYIEQYGEDEGAKQYNYRYASLFNASVGLYALPTMNTLNYAGYEIVDPEQEATTDPIVLTKSRIVKQFNDAYLIDPDACWIQSNVNLLAAVTDEEKEYRDMVLTDLDTYASELITNIILGRQSIDELDAGIKQLEEMGLTEIIAIEQARYDRAHPAE